MPVVSLTNLNRLLSIVVVAGLAIAAAKTEPTTVGVNRFGGPVKPMHPTAGAALMVLFSLPIMALIWFGDFFGQMTTSRIYPQTPGWLVAACGWLLLLGVPLITFWLRKNEVN